MKKIELVTLEELKTTFPKNSNVNLNEINGLQLEYYLQMYTLYRELLSRYLIALLSLDDYDKIIKDSNFQYKKVDYADMDIYQRFNSRNLDYFYIRNNIYLENLSKDEYEFLYKKLCSNNMFIIDNDTIAFIEQTYPKVIFENVMKNGSIINTNYGPESTDFITLNNSIVVGFRYDIYNNSIHDDEYDKKFNMQQNFVKELFEQMKNDFTNRVNIPISIFQYDEISIKKLTNKQK